MKNEVISFQAVLNLDNVKTKQKPDLQFFVGSISAPDKQHIISIFLKPIQFKKSYLKAKQQLIKQKNQPLNIPQIDQNQKLILDYMAYFRNK